MKSYDDLPFKIKRKSEDLKVISEQLSRTVKTVNGVSPDANGNVVVSGGGGDSGSNVTDSTTNGNILVDGVEIKVYDDTAINTVLSGKSDTNHNHNGVYEPIITTKNSAFNKNFGTTAGTVSEGNHTHSELHTHTNKAALDKLVNPVPSDNGKVLTYNSTSGNLEWVTPTSGGGSISQPNVRYLVDYSSYVSGSNWVPAFNQAFADLTASGGGIVQLGAATYNINSALTIPTNVHIRGLGEGISIIRQPSGVDADMITFDTNDNCGVSFLTLWGNTDGVIQGTSTTRSALVIGRAGIDISTNEGSMPNLGVHDIEIRSMKGNGIRCFSSTWVYLLSRVTIRYCTGYGMWVQSTDNVYSIMYIHSNGLAGLYVTGHNNRFSDMKIIFNGRGGQTVSGFLGNGADIDSAGVYCTGRRNTFVNVEAQENYGHGFVFDGSRECDLIGLLSDKNGYTYLAPSGTSLNTSNPTAVGFYFRNASKLTGILKSTNFNEGLVSQKIGYHIESNCSNLALDYEQDLTQTGKSTNLSLSSTVITAAMKADTHAFTLSNLFLESGQSLTNAITAYDAVNFELGTNFISAGYAISGNEITNVTTNWAGASRIGTKKDISVVAGNTYLVRSKVKPSSGSYSFRLKALLNEGAYPSVGEVQGTFQAGSYSDISFIFKASQTSNKLLAYVDDKGINGTQQAFSISEFAVIDITNAIDAGYTGKALDRVVKKNYFLGAMTFV